MKGLIDWAKKSTLNKIIVIFALGGASMVANTLWPGNPVSQAFSTVISAISAPEVTPN